MPVPSRELIIKLEREFLTNVTSLIVSVLWMENTFGYGTLGILAPCTTTTNNICQLYCKDWLMLIANSQPLMWVPTVDRAMGAYFENRV